MERDCAVLIPCRNEVATVARVVRDFANALPGARIYVFDNNSDDGTAEAASAAGATVIAERRQGKGFVVASMLEKIDADVYVLVDGDATYPADRVTALLAPLPDRADQVVGARRAADPDKTYPSFHSFGNRLVTFLVNRVFNTRLTDVMSGYRAFSREVARNVPILAGGFDVETEFTLRCLERGFVIEEVPVPYYPRPKGSDSKLSTVPDGARVLFRIATIVKNYRPLVFFGALSVLAGLLSLLSGYLPIVDYVRERYVYHVPLAILAGSLGIVSIVLLGIGIILAAINARFREIHALRRRDHARPRR